jgi:hypothetical protein
MATTDATVIFDIAFINELVQHLPSHLISNPKQVDTIKYLAKHGLLQRDRFYEFALAENSKGKYAMCSEDARDFTDDSDAKSVTVNYRESNGNGGKVLVTGIGNKVGALRVMAYDPAADNFRYYFIFDYESVRDYGRIEFPVGGNSKYNNGECGFELNSFAELAEM